MLKENGDEYKQLTSNTRNMFSSLTDSTFKITYLDEDGDRITISSLEEFQLALLHSQTTKFEVDTVSSTTESSASTPTAGTINQINGAVHSSVTCDECGMYPIIGDRFKCSLRKDFDLCSACEGKTVQPYPMLKIYNSEQNPAAFVVTLHENQFRNEQVDGEISMDDDDDEVPVDATPVPPTATATATGGGGHGCGQQGRRGFKCGGRGRWRSRFYPHDGTNPPRGPPFHRKSPSHAQADGPTQPPHGPPFHHGPPPGRGRGVWHGGWHGPFNQPFPFPFPHPFGCRDQQQRQHASTQNDGSDESSTSPNVSPEELKENLANVVSSVFTGVASMVNSSLQEESDAM